MLDSFEERLTELLAAGLAGTVVVRPRQDLGALLDDEPPRPLVVVRVQRAASDEFLGDDAQERLGQRGRFQLRTALFLTGEVAIELFIAEADLNVDPRLTRRDLMQAADSLLVFLQSEDVRNGNRFQTGADLGFDLSGFRFLHLEPIDEDVFRFRQLRVVYRYRGRFWPVEAPADGALITGLPGRVAVLPVQVPTDLVAMAGGSDVAIPVQLDLRALGGAPERIVARLGGSAAPGDLVGETDNVPDGFVAYAVDNGAFRIVYRPPVNVGTHTRVRVELGLAHPDRTTVPLGEFSIDVVP